MSNHSGSAPKWITCIYLEEMLQNALKNNKIRVHDFNIGPGSSIGDNYACQIFRIKCDCTVGNKKESKSIIGKAVPKTNLADDINKQIDFFGRETTVLSETLPLLHEILKEKNMTESFFPHIYKTDFENKIFFMEDLRLDGYTLANRKLSLDLDHVFLVIKALAKLHASSYLHFKKHPEHKNKYLDYFFKKQEGGVLEKMCQGMREYLVKSLHLWPISETDKDILRQLNFYDLMCDSYERKDSSFNALAHADCWTNNIMFKYENGKPISVKLLDFQATNYNSIGLDLNYFIFTSAQEKVKLEHLEDVFKTYHDTFVSITGDIDGFTIDTVRKEFIERLGFGLGEGLLFRPGTMSDTPFDIDAYVEIRESENNRIMYEGEEYIAETVKLLPMFKKYGVFK